MFRVTVSNEVGEVQHLYLFTNIQQMSTQMSTLASLEDQGFTIYIETLI